MRHPNQPPSSTMSESRPRPPKRFALESTDSARRQPARWESNHVLCLQLLISCHAAHAGSLAISRSSSTRTCAGRLHSCNEEPYRRPPRDPRRRVDTSLSSSDDYLSSRLTTYPRWCHVSSVSFPSTRYAGGPVRNAISRRRVSDCHTALKETACLGIGPRRSWLPFSHPQLAFLESSQCRG